MFETTSLQSCQENCYVTYTRNVEKWSKDLKKYYILYVVVKGILCVFL